jgi:hypothetical protein
VKNSLSILIHAAAKVGKSTLTSTAPTPILVLDAEGSWRFIRSAGFKTGTPLRYVTWDPNTGPPPRNDGTWNVCHVSVRRWQDLTNAYMWLNQAPHDFVSVVLDSITEVQRKLKTNLVGTEQMKMQDWGTLLTSMDKLIRDFRDLVEVPGTPLSCVIFVAETRQDNGKWRPYMQGQISIGLPYWVDVVGYLYPDHELGADGQPSRRVQRLLIGPHTQFETGERVQGRLPDIITEPSITQMLAAVYDTDDHSEEREKPSV